MEKRLPAGLCECGVCHKIVRVETTRWVATGDMTLISFDRRPKTPTGWRIGLEPPTRFEIEAQHRVCGRCGGWEEPAPQTPIWRQARDAWKEVDGLNNPELARMAPKSRYRR